MCCQEKDVNTGRSRGESAGSIEIAGNFVIPSSSQDDFVFLQSASLTSAT